MRMALTVWCATAASDIVQGYKPSTVDNAWSFACSVMQARPLDVNRRDTVMCHLTDATSLHDGPRHCASRFGESKGTRCADFSTREVQLADGAT